MNKQTPLPKEAISIHTCIFYLVAYISFIGCASIKNTKDDYLIVHEVINGICEIKDSGPLSFSNKADNHYLLDIFKENLKDSTFIKGELSRPWLSKGTASVNQGNVDRLKKIFTQENYSYIEKQIEVIKWSQEDINDIICREIKLVDVDAIDKKEWFKTRYKLF